MQKLLLVFALTFLAAANERYLESGFELFAALPIQSDLGEVAARALAVDPVRGVVVSDEAGHRLLVLGWGQSAWQVFAGGGGHGDRNGPPESARFSLPQGLTLDAAGFLYAADAGNHKIRKILNDGNVTAFAGSGERGAVNGAGSAARFNEPSAVLALPGGGFLVADTFNHKIRRVAADGTVSDYLGQNMGLSDGSGAQVNFAGPSALCLDTEGNLYVADTLNHAIRKVTPKGEVTTLAGQGVPGYRDGRNALFNYPLGVAWHPAGFLLVADARNHALRVVARDGSVRTALGGLGAGDRIGSGERAGLNEPVSVAVDGEGRILVLDGGNRRVALARFTAR